MIIIMKTFYTLVPQRLSQWRQEVVHLDGRPKLGLTEMAGDGSGWEGGGGYIQTLSLPHLVSGSNRAPVT